MALAPLKEVNLLDLTDCLRPEGVTNFEDPGIWLRALLSNGDASYEVCRRLSRAINRHGFDGFIYESFFQQAAVRTHKNVALFGIPICAGLFEASIGNARIANVAYDWFYGPYVKGWFDEEAIVS